MATVYGTSSYGTSSYGTSTGTWTEVSSTYPLTGLGGGPFFFGGGTLGSDYVLFQPAPGGVNPFDSVDARKCAAYWARYGGESFGTPWTGACPTTPSDGYITQAPNWGTFSGWATGITSGYTVGLPGIPSSYSVGVTQGHLQMTVDTKNAEVVAFFNQQAPGILEIQVLAVSATLDMNPNTAQGHAGDDWTAIIRKPATFSNALPQWIDPSELASFPQVGSIVPGGSTRLTLPLVAVADGQYYQSDLYLTTDLADVAGQDQDLGMSSSRGAVWLPAGVSLRILWRYRTQVVPPGPGIDDLGLEARSYFEP